MFCDPEEIKFAHSPKNGPKNRTNNSHLFKVLKLIRGQEFQPGEH